MQGRSENKRRRRLAALALLVAAVGSAAPAAGAQDAAGEPLVVGAGDGARRFLVVAPDAPTSPARLERAGQLDRDGRPVGPQPGWMLTSRVILHAADPAAVGALAGAAPAAGGARHIVGDFWLLEAGTVRAAAALAARLSADPQVREAYVDAQRPTATRCLPGDPFLGAQWHLKNLVDPGVDCNVEPAWCAGYTGRGVTIGIIDSGNFQLDHPDLQANHDPEATINSGGQTRHATRVAGVAAAVDGNHLGGVGAAFNAKLGSMPIGPASANAAAFLHRNDLIGVKNNSWGPPDRGQAWTMTSLELDALREGVEQGRAGLGVVYVWAGGNGGDAAEPDRVDYDPYASSRYTLAIGAYDDDDDAAAVNERGSSMLAVMPSRGDGPQNRGIYTTDRGDGYTSNFGGTSASAPAASGVVALLLEANPDLGWRDVQHVLIESARVLDPGEPGWAANGAGRMFNERYGFGAIDAGAAAFLAEGWTPVGPAQFSSSGAVTVDEPIPDGDAQGLTQHVAIDERLQVEHVELIVNASGAHIGDLEISVTAPSGVESVFATSRSDTQPAYADYLFTSVRHWGESSAGTWSVHVADPVSGGLHDWHGFELRISGTPAACPADIDGDGDADVADFFAYLDLFAAGDPRADIDGDGDVDVSDFFQYLDAFAIGCA